MEMREMRSDRVEVEFTEHEIDARESVSQSSIVPESIQSGHGEPRLVGIDFPRVDIEGCRLASLARLPKRPTNDCERELPQVAAAGCGHWITQDTRRSEWKLRDAARRALDDVRKAGSPGVAVSAPVNWKKAGVVPISFLDEDIECPLPPGNN